MRIACLQFAPLIGDVENNINLANAILDKTDPKHLDLLVLPEMAFSGEFFKHGPFLCLKGQINILSLPASYRTWMPNMPFTFLPSYMSNVKNYISLPVYRFSTASAYCL